MTHVPPLIALEHKSQPPTNNSDLGLYLWTTRRDFFKRNYSTQEMDVSAECRQNKPSRVCGWQDEVRRSNMCGLVVTVILHQAKHGSWRQASTSLVFSPPPPPFRFLSHDSSHSGVSLDVVQGSQTAGWHTVTRVPSFLALGRWDQASSHKTHMSDASIGLTFGSYLSSFFSWSTFLLSRCSLFMPSFLHTYNQLACQSSPF